MRQWILSWTKESQYDDPVVFHSIVDRVRFMNKTTQRRENVALIRADSGIPCHCFESVQQTVTVDTCLCHPVLCDGVIGYFAKIVFCCV